jgi:multiple sugar transport system permease protein
MKRKHTILLCKYAVLVIITIITLTPIFWTALSTLRTGIATNRSFFPSINEISLKNYVDLFNERNVFRFIKNSLMYSSFSAVICVALGVLAGYSLSRYKLPGKKLILTGFIVVMMIPALVLLVPLYFMLARINFVNRAALITIYVAGSIPFSVWLNKVYIDSIPHELDEAAYIDGCTKLKSLLHIILPLAMPGCFSSLIIIFVNAWNELIFAMTFLDRMEYRPITSGIIGAMGQYNNQWFKMNTFAIIACIPILLLFFFFQRYILGGLVAGAVKE